MGLGLEWSWGFLGRDQLSEHDVGKLLGFQEGREGRGSRLKVLWVGWGLWEMV